MAEENTTDSTPTPTPPVAAPAPTEEGSPSSTTTPSPAPADDEPTPGTILTTPEADEPAEDDPAAAFHGAPEGDYEISGLPKDTVIDTEAMAAVMPVAKELNLSNEGFSKLAGVYAEKVLPHVTAQVTDGIEQAVAAQHAAWATEATELVKTDPVFAGKSLKDIQQVSAKALDRFFGPDFRAFLDQTGMGNHPEMLKGMYQVGTQIAEDSTFERGTTAPAPKSRTEKYYGPAAT